MQSGPYRKGWNAFHAGRLLSDNPYGTLSGLGPDGEEWRSGWYAALDANEETQRKADPSEVEG